MSIKKRYNILIYLTLSLALICIVAGLISNGNTNTSNAIKEETTTKSDPLVKTNKTLIVKDYTEKISKEEITDSILTKEMLETWYKYDLGTIEYLKTKAVSNDTNIYSYKVEFKIYNQGATLPVNNGKKEGTEYITTNLIVNIRFNNETGSYEVDTVELP